MLRKRGTSDLKKVSATIGGRLWSYRDMNMLIRASKKSIIAEFFVSGSMEVGHRFIMIQEYVHVISAATS